VAWRKQGVGWHLIGLACSCRQLIPQHPDSTDVLAEKRRRPNRRYIPSAGVKLLGAFEEGTVALKGVAEVIGGDVVDQDDAVDHPGGMSR
jgi:hypothetical protein